MSLTRTGIADEIDRIDDMLSDLQKDKAEIYHAYREQLDGAGSSKPAITAEIAALKVAIRRRRELKANPDAVADKDARLDEVLDEITKASRSIAPAVNSGPAGGRPRDPAPTRARARETAPTIIPVSDGEGPAPAALTVNVTASPSLASGPSLRGGPSENPSEMEEGVPGFLKRERKAKEAA